MSRRVETEIGIKHNLRVPTTLEPLIERLGERVVFAMAEENVLGFIATEAITARVQKAQRSARLQRSAVDSARAADQIPDSLLRFRTDGMSENTLRDVASLAGSTNKDDRLRAEVAGVVLQQRIGERERRTSS